MIINTNIETIVAKI